MILSNTQRNSRAIENLAEGMSDNPYKFLYNFVGIDYTKPFSIKSIETKTIGKFWKFAEKVLTTSQDNYVIFKKPTTYSPDYKVLAVDIGTRTFDMSKSYNIDMEEVRDMFKNTQKFLLCLPKNSKKSGFYLDTARPKDRIKDISQFTNSVYLTNQVRVSNVSDVIARFIAQYTPNTEEVGETSSLDNNRYLTGMFFKGFKKKEHYTNLANSDLFNDKLVDVSDNLPLDKSGYNRYLYRRELHRRLNEYKSDRIFAEYDNYSEVKKFKEVEMYAKELFLDIVRKRSLSKLSHNRVKVINLVTNITTEYAFLMQELQKHFRELRKYRIDNNSEMFNSLEDVMNNIVELTKKFENFNTKYKKFSKQFR